MIFQPVINPIILGIILAAVFTFTIFLTISHIKSSKTLMFAWLRRSVAILFIGLALFRPGIPNQEETANYLNQYDIYFVVDTTASMVAEDWDSQGDTRLNGVKSDIGRIVDEYSGSRYSLLTFDSSATIRTPITKDASAVMSSVNILKPEVTRYSKGSSVGAAADLLNRTLAGNAETYPERGRIVFFFSDGEQTSDKPIESFANSTEFINGGAVYGYGTPEGGKMKAQDGLIITSQEPKYIMDTTKNPAVEALSVINPENLDKVASELGVNLSIRNSNEPVSIPELEDLELIASENETTDTVYDLTWVISLVVYILLAIEIAFILVRLSKIRKATNNG
jgi:Ca-activated chloride channel family protein